MDSNRISPTFYSKPRYFTAYAFNREEISASEMEEIVNPQRVSRME